MLEMALPLRQAIGYEMSGKRMLDFVLFVLYNIIRIIQSGSGICPDCETKRKSDRQKSKQRQPEQPERRMG